MLPNPLIVALDVANERAALTLVERLAPHVGMVKIGLELFTACGPAVVRQVRHLGVDVFLDLKLHDIPNTVAGAVQRAADLDVRLLTIHAAGGAAMVQAACAATHTTLQIVAVTVLTSLDDATLAELGMTTGSGQTAQRFGDVALRAGAAGLVCSSHELATLRALPGIRVVPGIRPRGSVLDDQKRVATPREAIDAGATWIVVGRPITAARDPATAAQHIVQSLHEDVPT